MGLAGEGGREIVPVGETLFINGLPFTIIGMFEHYESEQDRKARELAKAQAAQNAQAGAARVTATAAIPMAAAVGAAASSTI